MRTGTPEASLRSALDGCEPFRELDAGVLDEMFRRMQLRTYEPDERLIRQDEPGDCLFVLVEGHARIVLRSREGTSDEVGRFRAGEVVGEMALVTREPRSADVIAESRVQALTLPADDFHELAGRNLELGMVLTQLIGERLGQTARDGLGDKVIKGYRIERRAGRGAMAIVYRAVHLATSRPVALKMMSHRLVYESGALSRFRQEAEIGRSFVHRNVVRIHERFAAYNTEFLVMEYCDGPTLSELVKTRGAMPEQLVWNTVGQLASALHYVHERGVIHRDVKPSNAMLSGQGVIKLMDFGVARPDYQGTEITRTLFPQVMGTPIYMAPEQLKGLEVGRAADVYALALVALELLVGKRPFAGRNRHDLMLEKSRFVLRPAGRIGSGVGAEMHAFLSRALQPDPAARPTTLADLAAHSGPVDL